MTVEPVLLAARELLGALRPDDTEPRIVVDDAADGTTAADLRDALHARDAGLPLAPADDAVASGAWLAVVVVDAGADAGDDLATRVLEYLAAGSRVALVCTRIDDFWQWPQLLTRVRERVDPDHLCAVFAVDTERPEPRSGLAALVEWLSAEVTRPREARLSIAQLTAAAVALRPGDSSQRRRQLRSSRADLLATRDRGRSERLAALRTEAARLRAEHVTQARTTVRELVERSTTALAADDSGHADVAAEWYAGRLDELYAAAQRRATEAGRRLRAVTLAGLDAPHHDGGVGSQPGLTLPELPKRSWTADDALLLVLGASTGLGLGRLVAGPLAGIGAGGPGGSVLAVAAGLLLAWWMVRTRRVASRRHVLRTWLADSCAEARSRIEQAILAQFAAIEVEAAATVTRHYDRAARRTASRVTEIDARIDDLGRAAGRGPQAEECRRALLLRLSQVTQPLLETAAHVEPDVAAARPTKMGERR